ncbi:hypothetical protein [Prauserella endophytica]|uniref:DUF4349 domain-containing protein n=1 Tax=Prauserella endophytica TaxID=1592324 RepID=A0ABY2S0C6_9PSEU|nr:hypothetical protein [Prauserella endophytica]TKG67523.1 hypothetical protein FCN18_22440 [Prauserella endophytica]
MTELQRLELERRAVANEYTRTDDAVSWVGYHLIELLAVGLPLLLAVTITVWLLPLSVLAAGLWAGHAVQARRARRRQASAPVQRAETAAPGGESADESEEASA